MPDKDIEYWLTVLADDFSMYLYRTDDGKWCVSPDSYMSSSTIDPHRGHQPYTHHDGSPNVTDLHRDTVAEAILARRNWLKADALRREAEGQKVVDAARSKLQRLT